MKIGIEKCIAIDDGNIELETLKNRIGELLSGELGVDERVDYKPYLEGQRVERVSVEWLANEVKNFAVSIFAYGLEMPIAKKAAIECVLKHVVTY